MDSAIRCEYAVINPKIDLGSQATASRLGVMPLRPQAAAKSEAWEAGVVAEAVLVAQLCPTLCDPMGCSPPGSSVHGDFLGKNTGAGCHALLQGIFPGLPHCRRILYQLSYGGSPTIGHTLYDSIYMQC